VSPHLWYLLAGLIFVLMATGTTVLKRLPLTTSIIYLAVGFILGPSCTGVLSIDLLSQSVLLEHLAEAAVIISLFTTGLKLRLPLSDKRWLLVVRLAGPSMLVTIALVTAASVLFLDLPIGAGILLGAVMAPTDPVLASDVQVVDPADRNRLRFSLTGEAGLNDGMAFPFVMLGIGLLGLHELGHFGWRWITIDLIWAIVGGLLIGWTLGHAVGRLIVFLRKRHQESVGLDDFVALGLIALAYGLSLWVYAYGFLAVFAAGLALRTIERTSSNPSAEPEEAGIDKALATDPQKAPAQMASAVLIFNEQLERIAEVIVVVVLGILLSGTEFTLRGVLFSLALLFILRPIAVYAGLLGVKTSRPQFWLTAWFGIRGVGSLYYLTYAMNQGMDPSLAQELGMLTVLTIALSITLHGITATPLMKRYGKAA